MTRQTTSAATCPLPPGKRKYSTRPWSNSRIGHTTQCRWSAWRNARACPRLASMPTSKARKKFFTPCSNVRRSRFVDFQGWLPDEDLTLPELVDVYLDRLYATFSSPATMSIYRLLLAESARTPELVQRWHNEVALGLKERAQTIIHRNIRRGVIRPGVLTEHFFPLALAPAVLWLSSSMLSKGSPSISLVQLRDAHRQLLLELLQPQ